MSLSNQDPTPCEMQNGKVVLQVDELVPSNVEAISPVVEKLMKVINESDCAPKEPFDVETALREALANAVVHGNHFAPASRRTG